MPANVGYELELIPHPRALSKRGIRQTSSIFARPPRCTVPGTPRGSTVCPRHSSSRSTTLRRRSERQSRSPRQFPCPGSRHWIRWEQPTATIEECRLKEIEYRVGSRYANNIVTAVNELQRWRPLLYWGIRRRFLRQHLNPAPILQGGMRDGRRRVRPSRTGRCAPSMPTRMSGGRRGVGIGCTSMVAVAAPPP